MAARRLMVSFVVAVVMAIALVGVVVEAQTDCRGAVGAYAYDLAPLARKIGDTDLQTTDSRDQVYYYRVCGVVAAEHCDDVTTAAVCQKDARFPNAQYHELGLPRTAQFHQLPDRPESAGFALSFTGGEEDRSVVINFICDPSEEALFTFVDENPIKTYDLQVVSKHACPVNVGPSPPSRDDTCCLYAYNADPRLTRTLCSSACPTLSGYSLAGNWTVTTCSDCSFSRSSA